MKEKILRKLNENYSMVAAKASVTNRPVQGVIRLKINPIKGLFINTTRLCIELSRDVYNIDRCLVIDDVFVTWNRMTVYFCYEVS